jgi:hypothetical protein
MNNNNNAAGVSATSTSAKPKKAKPMTIAKFIKDTKKVLSKNPSFLELREYVKTNAGFISSFDFGSALLDKNVSDKEMLVELLPHMIKLETDSFEGDVNKAIEKAEAKQVKEGVSASIFRQVWDSKKRVYIEDEYEIAIVSYIDKHGDFKEERLVKFFPTEHEARHWAAVKLSKIEPGNRHKAEIVDMRGEKTSVFTMTYDQADKYVNTSFKGTQVTRTNGVSVPAKPLMKVKGGKSSFSAG